MKIIHTADLHLDSALNSHLEGADKKQRKAELLSNFNRLAKEARRQEVSAIIIAGDLFDSNKVSKTASKNIIETIREYADIDFYYLEGNHDNGFFISEVDVVPDNLKLFSTDWKSYCLNEKSKANIMLYGAEFADDNVHLYDEISLDQRNINIVTLHGQIQAGASKDKTELINLNRLKNKGIDYLALGHIHKPSGFMPLDNRGIYCYPGCLEGRGYDECGEHGYVLLTIDEETGDINKEFIPFANRKLYEVSVDITGCSKSAEMIPVIEGELEGLDISDKDYLRILLTGRVPMDTEIDTSYIWQVIKDDYYCGMVKDLSKVLIDVDSYKNDISLKGEFVRKVYENSSLTDEEKSEVLKMGFKAMSGERFIDED